MPFGKDARGKKVEKAAETEFIAAPNASRVSETIRCKGPKHEGEIAISVTGTEGAAPRGNAGARIHDLR